VTRLPEELAADSEPDPALPLKITGKDCKNNTATIRQTYCETDNESDLKTDTHGIYQRPPELGSLVATLLEEPAAKDTRPSYRGSPKKHSKIKPPNPFPLQHRIQRVRWTPDQESAILEEMKICGTAWAKIVERKHPMLKGRTNMNLKDKVRNLKFYFLGNGEECPEVLRSITLGESYQRRLPQPS
jgi:hypothetical protein